MKRKTDILEKIITIVVIAWLILILILLSFATIQSTKYEKIETDFYYSVNKYLLFCRWAEVNKKSEEECKKYLQEVNNKWEKLINEIEKIKKGERKEIDIAEVRKNLEYINLNK